MSHMREKLNKYYVQRLFVYSIIRNSSAPQRHQGSFVALICCFLIPRFGLHFICLNTHAGIVTGTQVVLCVSLTQIGGFAIP